MNGDRPVIYLKPGEIYFAETPVKVVTVLGSCISVTMHSRMRCAGAICHAVMPFQNRKSLNRQQNVEAFRYVDRSIDWMLSRFRRIGIETECIEVRVYGGAEIFSLNKGHRSIAVGTKNIETAMRILRDKKMNLTECNVGGSKGRKIVFYTDTGDVIADYVGCVRDLKPLTGRVYEKSSPHGR